MERESKAFLQNTQIMNFLLYLKTDFKKKYSFGQGTKSVDKSKTYISLINFKTA